MRSGLALLLLAGLAALQTSAPEPQWPGPKRDGFLLPMGWRLAPTGIQVPLPDTRPMTLSYLYEEPARVRTGFPIWPFRRPNASNRLGYNAS